MAQCEGCAHVALQLGDKVRMFQVLAELGFANRLIPTQIIPGPNVAVQLRELIATSDSLQRRYYLKSDVGCCSRQTRGGTLPELVRWIEECRRVGKGLENQYVLQA